MTALKIIKERMSFLISEHGFEQVSENEEWYGVCITYQKHKVAVEALWDSKEDVFEIKIGSLKEQGRLKHHITSFLIPKGIRDFGSHVDKTGNIFDDEIARFIFLAKTYLPDLLKKGSDEDLKEVKV